MSLIRLFLKAKLEKNLEIDKIRIRNFFFLNFFLKMEKKFKSMLEDLDKKIKEANQNHVEIKNLLARMTQQLELEKSDTQKVVSLMHQFKLNDSDTVKLNIGGKLFSTYKSTLMKRIKKPHTDSEYYEPHLLQALVSGVSNVKLDENEAIFIDRDPTFFHIILNYLRYVNTNVKMKLPDNYRVLELVKRECDYYKLHSLFEMINQHLGDYVIGSRDYIHSNVLSNEQFDFLIDLCELPTNGKWILIYQASDHGFGAEDFHFRCNGRSKTLTIIQTTLSFVFGGYTSKEWSSKGGWNYDEDAVIFSMFNSDKEPIAMKCVQPQYAIYCNSFYGPTFGGGHSIYVASNSNRNILSHSNIGYTYKHPSIEYDTDKARSFMAGSYHFQTTEIEVFKFEPDEAE